MLSTLQLYIIVLKVIRKMADEKEGYYDYDTEIDDFGLHDKFFTAFNGDAMGFKEMDLDLVVDLMDRAQLMMGYDNFTEDALRRLTPGNE